MSKKSKSEARKRRASHKRALKAANQARWAEYAGKEGNRKKKVNVRRKAGMSLKHTHPFGPCGNIGCLKCSGVGRIAQVKLLFKISGPKYATKAADRFNIVLH